MLTKAQEDTQTITVRPSVIMLQEHAKIAERCSIAISVENRLLYGNANDRENAILL